MGSRSERSSVMKASVKVLALYTNFLLSPVVGALQCVSGLVLSPVLPRGQAHRGLSALVTFMGLSRGDWESVHIVSGLLLLALVIVHLVLNWPWIKSATKSLVKVRGREAT